MDQATKIREEIKRAVDTAVERAMRDREYAAVAAERLARNLTEYARGARREGAPFLPGNPMTTSLIGDVAAAAATASASAEEVTRLKFLLAYTG